MYNLVSRGPKPHFGHVEGHPCFWGDICLRRIRYCRNFVFRRTNTLSACPYMPYTDPDRPYVQAWYAASEGANCHSFLRRCAESEQDRLEEDVGMGSATHPLPRLLRAMGWTVRAVPFYFRMLRASYCVRHLAPLRSTAIRRLAGAVAAASGAAAVGAAVMHRVSASAQRAAAGWEATPISRWTAAADGAWEAFGRHVTFGVLRTAATLPYFYSFDARSPRAWWISRGGAIEGWFGLLIAPMTGNSYFGDLVVATLTDCVGTPEAVRAGVLLAADEAKASGADLLITNQQHRLLAESCRAAGWRAAPSNFLTATSRALSEACDVETTYVTRRDGDGLTHLGG